MSVLAPERTVENVDFVAADDLRERQDGPTVGTLLRIFGAGSVAGAAAIHFVYAPAHFDEYWAYGAFFVAAACVQLVCAGLLLGVTRPRREARAALWAVAAVNVAVIVVWIVSRRVGTLIGPGASTPESIGYPDLLATVLEAVTVEVCLLLLLFVGPRFALRRVRSRWLAVTAVGAVLAVIGATVAYAATPRFTASHSHSHGGTGVTAAGTGDGHTHGAPGSGAAAPALTGDTPCEKSGPPESEGQVFNAEGHTHRGPAPSRPIDQATRLQLEKQQTVAREVAARYPTVADAQRGGYQISTVYVPCIGAHYTNIPLAGRFDPGAPSELLYDGTSPNARIVGLSYLVWHPGGAPEGFAGPNDVWHQHNFNGGLCINASGLVVGAESTSRADCAARGGAKVPLVDIWMVHDWVVPGFECTWGVFAAECPELGGRLNGTAWDAPKG